MKFGPYFTATLAKTENKEDMIRELQYLKEIKPALRLVKNPQLAERVQSPVVINDEILRYEDTFGNLSAIANKHEIVIWDKLQNDEVFVEKLIKPHSWYWTKDKPDNDMIPKEKIIQLGEGSTFSDKVTMLGIVEATFGG